MKKESLIKLIKNFALNNIERDEDNCIFGDELNELFNSLNESVMEEINKEGIKIIF